MAKVQAYPYPLSANLSTDTMADSDGLAGIRQGQESKVVPALRKVYREAMNHLSGVVTRSRADDCDSCLQMSRSTVDLLNTRIMCDNVDSFEDLCSGCKLTDSKTGKKGHAPWDELELLRHGWVNRQCQHWNRLEPPKDDITLLKEGLVDNHGHNLFPPPPEASVRSQHSISSERISGSDNFKSGQVIRFGSAHSVYIPDDREAPARSSFSVGSETIVTLHPPGQLQLNTFKLKDGSEIVKCQSGPESAYLLTSEDKLVYVQRGGKDGDRMITASASKGQPANISRVQSATAQI